MENSRPYAVQVLIASGPEALDRAVLGFAFALSAATCGADATVILTLKGSIWAKQDVPEARQTVNGFSSISEYIALLRDSGAVVRFCSSCAERGCTLDTSGKGSNPGFSYTGLVEVAIRTMQGAATTVVF